ncbi:MAG TPA: hypothetical protein VG122_24230, partial [Gemmata sp.]|nr:hypothetical protein [Gemmata sp.]
MIGEVILSQPRNHRGWAILWFFVAACFAVAAVFIPNLHLAVFAVFPCILGITSLILDEQSIEFEVTKDGLVFAPPASVSVPYNAIQGITAPTSQPGNNFAIQLY